MLKTEFATHRLFFFSKIQPEAIPMKLLQVCACKSVNIGVFLTSLVVTHIVKINLLALVFTLIQNTLAFEHKHNEFDNILAIRQLKNSPVITDL